MAFSLVFSGCAATSHSVLFGNNHYSIVKKIEVNTNFSSEKAKYLTAGLKRGALSDFTTTYSPTVVVKSSSDAPDNSIKVSFYDQHGNNVMNMTLEADRDKMGERDYPTTLDFVAGKILDVAAQYDKEKNKCLCGATSTEVVEDIPILNPQKSENVPDSDFKPIPLPKI